MKPLALLLLLSLAACRSRVTVPDVVDAFVADEAKLALRAPTREDPSPTRAANAADAMRETERRARAYLAATAHDKLPRRYVQALLACSLLAQGRTLEARDVVREIRPRREEDIVRENAVIDATTHAVGVSRAADAYVALERFFAGELEAERLIADYGSFLGIRIPPGREGLLVYEAHKLERMCLVGEGPDPEAHKALHRRRLRGLVGQTFYNEAASLLVNVKPPPPGAAGAAIERWLGTVVVSSMIVYGQYLVPVLLPQRMSASAKDWEREHIVPTYERARKVAGSFLSRAERDAIKPGGEPRVVKTRGDVYKTLYARLLTAEVAALGWIDTH